MSLHNWIPQFNTQQVQAKSQALAKWSSPLPARSSRTEPGNLSLALLSWLRSTATIYTQMSRANLQMRQVQSELTCKWTSISIHLWITYGNRCMSARPQNQTWNKSLCQKASRKTINFIFWPVFDSKSQGPIFRGWGKICFPSDVSTPETSTPSPSSYTYGDVLLLQDGLAKFGIFTKCSVATFLLVLFPLESTACIITPLHFMVDFMGLCRSLPKFW